jgi:murein hydrolase activator
MGSRVKRASSKARQLAVALGMAASVIALSHSATADPPARGDQRHPPGDDGELRELLTQLIADQRSALASAVSSVDEKLAEARQLRQQRARVAYRIATSRPRSLAFDPLRPARIQAALGWLLARDQSEAAMLSDEDVRLRTALAGIDAAAAQVAQLALPPRGLPWPAKGNVARPFGTFEHERSGTTLSRRGIDIEVEAGTRARAVAAGIVVYAGPVRGLDLGVLIDHGAYWSLIAKLSDLVVAQGQVLPSTVEVGRAARSRVYFELRLRLLPAGTPIDPERFLLSAREGPGR